MTSSPLFLAAFAVAVSGSLFDSSTCNHEKACFLPSNANCYMGCNGMGFSYVFADAAQQLLKIELFGNSTVGAKGFYFAVGFSLDTLMGSDSVIECSSIGTADPSLKFSYNVPNFNNTGEPSNIRIANTYDSYFINPNVTYSDGQIYCSATVNVSGDPKNYQVFKFDANVRYYLLMANGPTDNNGLKHHVHDVTTSSAVNLADIHPSFDPNGCGVTKGCFIPSADECNGDPGMLVSYSMKNDTHLQLEIVGRSSSGTGNYVAVGFSKTGKMANTSVLECSSLGKAALSTKFSYNNAQPTNVRIAGEQNIRSSYINDLSYYQDGQLFCTATVRVSGYANDPRIFTYDPNQAYYLLLARGPTNSSGLFRHTSSCVAKNPLELSQLEPYFDPSTCDQEKTCFVPTECYMGCNGMGFSFKMINETLMKIELFSVATLPGYYVALGFSLDDQMGDDHVIECSSLNNSTYSLKFSYNTGGDNRYNTRITGEEQVRNQLITDSTVAFSDGRLYCSATVNVAGIDNLPQILAYDKNKDYYLLLASGQTSASGLQKHFDHVVSDLPYDLMSGNTMPVTNPYFDCSRCGHEKGCFFPDDPENCNGFGFAWTYVNDTVMIMELMKKGDDGWVAVGFSSDDKMGDDSVVECSKLQGEQFSFKFSYNDETPKNARIDGEKPLETTYFTNSQYNITDGLLYCRATVNIGGSNLTEVFKFNSSLNYYLLLAQGATNATQILPHSDAAVSPSPYNLTTMTATPLPTTTPPNNTNFVCSQCTSEKGCFFPEDDSKGCTGIGFAYSYVDATTLQMELMGTGSNGYLAVGFSSDKSMGPASVVECSQLGTSTFSFKFSYNTGDNLNERISGEQPLESTYFTNTSYKVSDGQIYCKASVNVGGSDISSQVFHWNASKNYFLILAQGSDSSDGLSFHGKNHFVTDNAVNLTVVGSARRGGIDPTVQLRLIHAHAIMMILAWICFVPTALLFARFLRSSWPLVKPGGLLIWFHVHRTCNLVGIALMIASFVCIMCANSWKWSGPGSSSKKWSQVHTMTGLFALIFAWMQPFVSFMRCHPNTPNRPIFNWTHRLIGVVSYILAATTLGVAAYHFPQWGGNPGLKLALVLIPIALMTIQTILFPILDKFQEKDENHVVAEMVRQVVVLVSVGLLVGLAIALSIMVST